MRWARRKHRHEIIFPHHIPAHRRRRLCQWRFSTASNDAVDFCDSPRRSPGTSSLTPRRDDAAFPEMERTPLGTTPATNPAPVQRSQLLRGKRRMQESPKSARGNDSATPHAHASNGCSQPKKPAPKWAAHIPTPPMSHNHCDEVLARPRRASRVAPRQQRTGRRGDVSLPHQAFADQKR